MASLHGDGTTPLSAATEATPLPAATNRRRGGSITIPFIIATVFLVTVAGGGWTANLIVFLIKEFNMKRIDAVQVSNVVSGCVNFIPVVAAVLADSLLGCFSLIWISSLISLLGLILLLLTVVIHALKPSPSQPPSPPQYALLYSAIALTSMGMGGTRFTLATMGANQLEKMRQQSTFFNYYFFSLYAASFISSTAIVYVQDNVGWRWGFGIAIAANTLGLALFLAGAPYYRREHPRAAANPFTSLLRVAVAAFRKRKVVVSSCPDYYYGDDDHHHDGVKRVDADAPTNWFRTLNRAAVKTEGDVRPTGKVTSAWKLCTVQQVEDLKSIIRVMPLWSSSILLGTPIGVQLSLTVLQSLASDRHVINSFQFPASSIIVFSFLSTALGVFLIDNFFRPMWRKTTAAGKNPTPLQQIGVGHVLTIGSMAISALVEARRRRSAESRHLMSVAWLVPQMVVVGVGEAFHFPGQVVLYYQEFPSCLKSLSTAMVAMLIGVAFYLSTAVVDFIRRATDWLPDDIDNGRLDCVYWVMMIIGLVNFGYFLVISWFYHYKNEDVVKVLKEDQSLSADIA